jgi:hypothetical protein
LKFLYDEASGNVKALALIKKMSPAAWRHVHLNGHYTFRGGGQMIDLDAIVAQGCSMLKNKLVQGVTDVTP